MLLSISMTTVTIFIEPFKPLKGWHNLSTEFMQGVTKKSWAKLISIIIYWKYFPDTDWLKARV